MHGKKIFLELFLVASSFFIFPKTNAQASSVPCEFFSDNPGRVVMIDGKDRYSQVAIKARLSSSGRSMFDFGFMNAGLYVPITDASRGFRAHTFAGNDMVDFALRSYGSDRIFGTPDDFIYRLSDGAKYAGQSYFYPLKTFKSRRLKTTPVYFRALRLDWDIDLDGYSDAHAILKIKGSQYDGLMPAAAAVPLLPAAWFFGSGLVGLLVLGRKKIFSQKRDYTETS